jgi:hypothetical protein
VEACLFKELGRDTESAFVQTESQYIKEISMWRTNVSKIAIGLAWLVTFGGLFAADVAGTERQLSISDGRPVAKAVEVLSHRHGLVVTYEDPPYAFERDLQDVAAAVSRSAVKPGQKMLVPRDRAMELTYSLSATGKLEHPDALIRRVLDTHLAAGAGSQFELIQQGGVFHVVPMMVKDSKGAWVATRSILDTSITVPVQSRTGVEMVDAICKTLSAATKVRVAIGLAPFAAMDEQVLEGGTNEPARDILSRTLKQLSEEKGRRLGAREERQYVWQLFFDPNARIYFLNLRLLPGQAEVATPNPDEHADDTALDPQTGRKRKE